MAENVVEISHIEEAVIEDKIIDLWVDFPCLYDVQSKDFKNREKRDFALNEISAKINQNVEWLKAKLRSLRNTYTKAKKAPKSGSMRKNSKRNTWLIERLQFLAPHVAIRQTISNLDQSSSSEFDQENEHFNYDDDDNEIDDEETGNNDTEFSPCRINKPQSMKRVSKMLEKKQIENEYEIMKGLAQSIVERNKRKRTEDGDVDAYGKYVTNALSKLEPNLKNIAQFHINRILFQAQMNTLEGFENTNVWHSDQFSHRIWPYQNQPQSFAYPQNETSCTELH